MAALVQVSNNNGLFPNPLTGGNTVYMCGIAFNGGVGISSSAPTIGGVPASNPFLLKDKNSPTPSSALVYGALWRLPNIAGGGTQMGLTFSSAGGATQQSLPCIEVSGMGSAPAADGTPNAGQGASAGPADSGSTGPVGGTGDTLLACTVGFALTMSSPTAGWSTQALNSSFGYFAWQFPASSGGTYDFQSSYTGTGDWAAAIAAETPGSGGANISAHLAAALAAAAPALAGSETVHGALAVQLAPAAAAVHGLVKQTVDGSLAAAAAPLAFRAGRRHGRRGSMLLFTGGL